MTSLLFATLNLVEHGEQVKTDWGGTGYDVISRDEGTCNKSAIAHVDQEGEEWAKTDIVEVQCLAVNADCQLGSLPLLGPWLLAPDITDLVCARTFPLVQRSRQGGEHIWLLDVECCSHGGQAIRPRRTQRRLNREVQSRSSVEKIRVSSRDLLLSGLSELLRWGW